MNVTFHPPRRHNHKKQKMMKIKVYKLDQETRKESQSHEILNIPGYLFFFLEKKRNLCTSCPMVKTEANV